ncbi:diacylglycerol kinase [Ottowia beijingensis]|uniref:Diacylglycerol kinase n=1 Tax=Ottowia beijingensis TaxID=1207057 RepID=A0A853IZ93_9BURK|nr:diacylglycerol kinase family protein [Ottowia beijingensis]NZA03253.1 diacylglycerol kinase [Ottowia beijingensis]NZA03486.1 diacylglycerol kinase [Ottowia beijingensis]
MPSAPAPLFLVFNAASGRGDTPDVSRHVAERLRAAGRRAECFVARQPGELGAVIGRAVNAARDARGIVVAAGGDSTLNAVAQAVWNAGLPMGVLPQGSLNYFGRTHGMSTDLDAAVDALLGARVQPVPVGMVGERLFLVNASVGLYPRLLEAGGQRHGRSRLVAWIAGLGTLLRGRSLMTLELHDGTETRVVRTRTLFVGHNDLQLRALGLREPLAAEAGRLLAITLPPAPPLATLWRMLRGSIGRLDGAARVDSFSVDRLVVQPGRGSGGMQLAIDGELAHLPAPLVFQLAPRPLRLLVPTAARGLPGLAAQ